MIPIGTLFNIATVLFGGLIGLMFKKIIKPDINKKIFFVMGLFTLVLGFSIAIKTTSFILMLIALVLGTMIGEYYDIDFLITNLLDKVKNKFKIKDENFSDGFLTAFVLFCVGSMTIVGSIDEGLGKPPNILYTKAIMDGFSSVILASTFGVGVLFSTFPMLIFQGSITLLAFTYKDFFPASLIEHISCVGGVLIIAIGIKILGYNEIKPTNMLPSLVLIILIYLLKVKIGL